MGRWRHKTYSRISVRDGLDFSLSVPLASVATKAAGRSPGQELPDPCGRQSFCNNRVIFNIKGNDYRLIVSINFRTEAAYVIWFGPHKEYDKIDSSTVEFKIK